jgi:hypothetical protein
MAKSVRETLDAYGVRAVAEASGIPFWTLRKWRDRDRIPGEGVAHDMRARAVQAGIAKLKPREARRRKGAE